MGERGIQPKKRFPRSQQRLRDDVLTFVTKDGFTFLAGVRRESGVERFAVRVLGVLIIFTDAETFSMPLGNAVLLDPFAMCLRPISLILA